MANGINNNGVLGDMNGVLGNMSGDMSDMGGIFGNMGQMTQMPQNDSGATGGAQTPVPAKTPRQVSEATNSWVHQNLPYLNSFLATQVGRHVEMGYIFGSGRTTQKRGRLMGVGYNYIIIEDDDTGDITACDFYSIKFVRIIDA